MFTIQTCRWQWGTWAAAEPDFVAQVLAHQMLSGRTAAADGATPAGCCLEGATAREESPPAWRHEEEEKLQSGVCTPTMSCPVRPIQWQKSRKEGDKFDRGVDTVKEKDHRRGREKRHGKNEKKKKGRQQDKKGKKTGCHFPMATGVLF